MKFKKLLNEDKTIVEQHISDIIEDLKVITKLGMSERFQRLRDIRKTIDELIKLAK